MDVMHDSCCRTWLGLCNSFEHIVPPYVMDYKLPAEKTASAFEDNLFADQARRLFPTDCEASTWLAAAYFAKNAADLKYGREEATYVESQIKEAADIFGIRDDVDKIMGAIRDVPVEKQAEDNDANYGLVLRDEKTGEVLMRKYFMVDDRGVKLASEYFDQYRGRYPLNIRRSIAKNIMSKAAEFGVDVYSIKSSVLREAGFGIPRKDVLMSEILERAQLTKDAEASIALANINELIVGLSDTEIGENLDKIAEVIDAFDREAGLTRHYGVRITTPADMLYDIDLKMAEALLEDSVELNQHIFSLNKLAELPVGVFTEVLGDGFASSITKNGNIVREKLADELHSLPRPDKAALEDHLVTLYS